VDLVQDEKTLASEGVSENERKLTDARSRRDPSAVSGNDDFVGWRGIEEVGGIVVDVLWRSRVNDEPEVGGDSGWDMEQGGV